MMRKRFLLIAILLCLSSMAFAVQGVSVGLGGGAYAGLPVGQNGYGVSLEGRAKVMWFGFTVSGSCFFQGTGGHEFSVMGSVGPSVDLGGKIRLGLEIGPRFRVVVDADGNPFLYDMEGDLVPAVRTLDYFSYSPVSYRATIEWIAGHLIFGVAYQVDTKYRFKRWSEVKELGSVDWETGTVGCTIKYMW